MLTLALTLFPLVRYVSSLSKFVSFHCSSPIDVGIDGPALGPVPRHALQHDFGKRKFMWLVQADAFTTATSGFDKQPLS